MRLGASRSPTSPVGPLTPWLLASRPPPKVLFANWMHASKQRCILCDAGRLGDASGGGVLFGWGSGVLGQLGNF